MSLYTRADRILKRMSLRFGDATLDVNARRLERDGRTVHLTAKAFQLLVLLVEHRPKALSKVDIHEALWPKTFVAESNLRALVNEVRTAIGDSGGVQALVRTVHGFGYAFEGEVREATPRRGARPPVVHKLSWAGEEAELEQGENVIGRDSDAAVWIGDESVSRRHARVVVDGDAAVLEDLHSKNGTFRGDEPVSEPVELKTGDTVRVGVVPLKYRRVSASASTRTPRTP